jgi:hypothetical protein
MPRPNVYTALPLKAEPAYRRNVRLDKQDAAIEWAASLVTLGIAWTFVLLVAWWRL